MREFQIGAGTEVDQTFALQTVHSLGIVFRLAFAANEDLGIGFNVEVERIAECLGLAKENRGRRSRLLSIRCVTDERSSRVSICSIASECQIPMLGGAAVPESNVSAASKRGLQIGVGRILNLGAYFKILSVSAVIVGQVDLLQDKTALSQMCIRVVPAEIHVVQKRREIVVVYP